MPLHVKLLLPMAIRAKKLDNGNNIYFKE